MTSKQPANRWKRQRQLWLLLATLLALHPASAEASIFKGETLDKVADVLSWIVLFIVPVVAIAVFWLVHILPEKIAEKKKHPQAKAIQTLCLLSLAFGGLLWPLAWLWAYTKPVLHKIAYGTDVDETHGHTDRNATSVNSDPREREIEAESDRLRRLRAEVVELETKLASARAREGKAN